MRKVFLLVFLVVVLITGCSTQVPGPKFDEVSTDKYGCSYLIDQRTGVVYLEYHNGDIYGITVMLNADGTPVTANQLEVSTDYEALDHIR